MDHRARLSLLACLLAVGPALAGERLSPPPTPLDTTPPLSVAAASDCRLGNLSATTVFSGWWEGFETYAFLVDPEAEGCGCALGVSLQRVHLVLGLDPGDTPEVQVRLLAAVSQGGCLRPGPPLDFSVALPLPAVAQSGYHDVALDVNFSCAEAVTPYFVAVEFLDDTGDGIDLVGGGNATPCRTWNDWGQGWYDLVADIGFTRDLTFWAEFDCCSAPVAATRRTWSSLKAGYLGYLGE